MTYQPFLKICGYSLAVYFYTHKTGTKLKVIRPISGIGFKNRGTVYFKVFTTRNLNAF